MRGCAKISFGAASLKSNINTTDYAANYSDDGNGACCRIFAATQAHGLGGKGGDCLVWLLLLLLGVEVGGNGMIIGNLHRLGLNALIIATLATAVSVAASVLLWRNIKSKTGDDSHGNNPARENHETLKQKAAQPEIVPQQKREEEAL